jgi:UDP-glucose 4-epimerase
MAEDALIYSHPNLPHFTLTSASWPPLLDDLSTGSIKNVAHLEAHLGSPSALDSMMNRSLILELIDQTDMVFRLAAAVGVRLIVEEPVHTLEANIKTTALLLDLRGASRSRPCLPPPRRSKGS